MRAKGGNYMRNIKLRVGTVQEWGKTGENNAAALVLDVTENLSLWPDGQPQAVYYRPDGTVYPLPCSLSGSTVEVPLTATETATAGRAQIEIQWIDEGVLAKSATHSGNIAQSLAEPGDEPPEPMQSWLDQLTGLAGDAAEAAEDAAVAQGLAEGARDEAQGYATGMTTAIEEALEPITEELALKADKATTYTKTEADAAAGVAIAAAIAPVTSQLADIRYHEGVYEYTSGSINSADGKEVENLTRMRNVSWIHIDEFVEMSIKSGYNLNYFAYDFEKGYLGTSGWVGGTIAKANINAAFPLCEYIRVIFRKNNGADLTQADVETSGISIQINTIYETARRARKNEESIDALNATIGVGYNFKYEGLPIKVSPKLKFDDTGLMVLSEGYSIQGGAFCNDFFFQFYTGGSFAVFDTITNARIGGVFKLDESAGISPHCNSVCFGNEYHTEGDEFPLLYVNSYQDVSLPKGTCYVYRLTRIESAFDSVLVQTISINFTTDEIWVSSPSDTRQYGNFVVDTENSHLYAYVPRDSVSKTRFFRFALPKLSEGSSISLGISDILSYYDTEHIKIPQDTSFAFGKIYVCSGAEPNFPALINVFNAFSGQLESRISWKRLGFLNYEPESICVHDGNLYSGASKIYRFSF
jgi:hypothetical protein